MADNKKAVCGGFLVGDGLEFEGKTLKATSTGGAEDYTELENKPSINNVELNGNKTLEDLGIASKDDLDTVVESVDDIVDDIETIDTTLQQHNDKIAANSSRIDTFTHLPEGSTTGDAELADIRVGYDGKTYNSAGSAVRDQVSGLKQDLADLTGGKRVDGFADGYIDLGQTIGTVINLTPKSQTGLRVLVAYCVENEKFTITTVGSSGSARAYGFVDAQNKLLYASFPSVVLSSDIIIAPTGASKIIVNDTSGTGVVYRGIKVGTLVNELAEDVAILEQDMSEIKPNVSIDTNTLNAYISSGKISSNSTSKVVWFECKKGVKYHISLTGKHNRFIVGGCMSEPKVNVAVTTIYSSGSTATKETEEILLYTNQDYEYIAICVAYKLEDSNADVEVLQNYQVYTVDELGKKVEELGNQTYNCYVCNLSNGDVNKTSGVYALYDDLVSQFPDYVAKNVIGQDTAGTNINEYVFSTGNYNAKSTNRTKDSVINKPIVLVTTGVHGYERSSVLSCYNFFANLCEYHKKLYPLREGIVFKVVPVVTPNGYDSNSRLNTNGVNINRNFDANWSLTPTGNDYSGTSPASETETQVMQSWIRSNTDAAACIDWHNSGYTNEVSYFAGFDTNVKMSYLHAIDTVIPKWKGVNGFSDNLVFSYTGNFGTGGMLYKYAQNNGIEGFCLETSWNQNDTGLHGDLTLAIGAEVFGNMMLKYYHDFVS